MRSSILAFVLVVLGASHAGAQALPESGYELAFSGSSAVRGGRDVRFRGVAYRVRGLSTLVAFAGPVRARFRSETTRGDWRAVTSDAHGRFEVVVPIGRALDEPRIEVEVGPEDAARSFELPVSVASAIDVRLFTDRRLYEPGEPVHVWALVRDAVSGAPIANDSVAYVLTGPAIDRVERTIVTNEAGVASFSLTLGEHASAGSVEVAAHVEDVDASVSFRVGRRVWERLFAHADVEPREVAPGGEATVRVHVTTPDGTPVRDANVETRIADAVLGSAITDASGDASIVVRAPAYLGTSDTGAASIVVHVAHPAHGSIDTSATMRIAIPLSLTIDVVAAHAALVPEVDDLLYVQLSDSLGDPPPAGTRVEVQGACVPTGRASAVTDANGFAEVHVRLPIGASAGAYGERRASVTVHVLGLPLERLAHLTVPVANAPEILPSTLHPVVAPGATIDVSLARRPSAARSSAVVELIDASHGDLLEAVFIAPRAGVAHLHVPLDRLGQLTIRARAVHEDESLEGVGGATSVLVVPAHADFVSLVPEHARWQVGETAHVDLVSTPNGPRAWGALLVRDLAAHGGETDFATYYLERAFDEALLHPEDTTGERLVRISLAALTLVDGEPPESTTLVDGLGLPRDDSPASAEAPERDVLRDPWPLARELERRGAGQTMVALENALTAALDADGIDAITQGAHAQRHFRADALDADTYPTLGAGGTTPAMLTAVDASFTYEHVARRVARARLVALLASLAAYLDPGDDASLAARAAYREPWQRWLGRMVERGVIADAALDDPWGGRFALVASTHPAFVLSTAATGVELASPGPDGRLGTSDDVRDPFVRVVDAGTPYAVASGEDALMRALSILSPVQRTLPALRAAYARVSAEMTEDEIGDAVHASVSEGTIGLSGFGMVGHGSGGGSGYGSGSGQSAPMTRQGASSVIAGVSGGNLGRLVRERFPPTVLFTPTFDVDASGHTRLDILLADAVTTYRVEVIVWRADGWIWSARTELEADREIVVDAPIPAIAHLGDRLVVPLRVSNRGTGPRTLRVALLGDDALGIADSAEVEVTVEAGGGAAVPFEIAPTIRASGSLRAVVSERDGTVLDAVRRPLEVLRPARTVRLMRETLVEGQGVLRLVIPPNADPRSASLTLRVGAALFDGTGYGTLDAWARGPSGDLDADDWSLAAIVNDLDAPRVPVTGFAIGAAYARAAIPDEEIRAAAEALTTALDASHGDAAERVLDEATTLIGLSRALRYLDTRPALATDMRRLADRIARDIGDGALGLDDQVAETVLAAAALATAGGDRRAARATELLRRAEPSLVSVGGDLWVAVAEESTRTTLAFAMAEVALGHRARAFALLATVARWQSRGRGITRDDAALASAIARDMASSATPEHARVVLDGAVFDLDVAGGRGTIALPLLATSGTRDVAIDVGGPVAVYAFAQAEVGVAWDVPPERAGPFALSIEGETGGQDDVAALVLVVTNRSPRWIAMPVAELSLPTGAEITALAHDRIERVVRVAYVSDALVRVTLHPLAPGASCRVPLPIRWSIAGTLAGIGVAAYATDRDDAVSILAPVPLVIAPTPTGAP